MEEEENEQRPLKKGIYIVKEGLSNIKKADLRKYSLFLSKVGRSMLLVPYYKIDLLIVSHSGLTRIRASMRMFTNKT